MNNTWIFIKILIINVDFFYLVDINSNRLQIIIKYDSKILTSITFTINITRIVKSEIGNVFNLYKQELKMSKCKNSYRVSEKYEKMWNLNLYNIVYIFV